MMNPPANILDCLLIAYSFSFVLLQCLLLALYRIVLSVLILGVEIISQHLQYRNAYLIHWGMGRFCLPFLASFCLILNVLRADILSVKTYLKIQWWVLALKSKLRIKAHRYHNFYTTKNYKESQIEQNYRNPQDYKC